ncbi:MAG: DegV family protein [Clostridia bacterium]
MLQIVTDSLSDITQQEAAKLQLTVLPLSVIFDGKAYLDGVTVSREEFYERLESGKTLPTTSQVSPEAFSKAFEAALAAGDEVLCLTGSGEISGTIQSALIARDMQKSPERVHVLDTVNATIGEALLVREAVRLRAQGLGTQELIDNMEALIPRVRLIGQVENLKHLVRGGRLNATSARLGMLVQLKPTLRLKNGKISQDGMKRGHKRVLEWFCEQLTELPFDAYYPVYIAAGHSPEARQALRTALMERGVHVQSIREMDVGCVIGTHTGAGCLAMAWVEKG